MMAEEPSLISAIILAAPRLENPETEALRLIEFQTGANLGKADIQRLDDIFPALKGHPPAP
jgi:hypothetical protein